MLDFYAVDALDPWPDDLPSERVHVGSLDIEEFHECLPLINTCFERMGFEASYFADWILTAEQIDSALACLVGPKAEATASALIALGKFVNAVGQARGRTLLAVCD